MKLKTARLFIAVFLLVIYAPIMSCIQAGVEAARSEHPLAHLRDIVQLLPDHLIPWLTDQGLKAPLTIFASDAYYYLTVAHNSVDSPFYTFDTLHPTNGFQPLWQFYLTSNFRRLNGDQNAEILAAFYSSLVFPALGTALFALVLFHLTGSEALSLLGLTTAFWLRTYP